MQCKHMCVFTLGGKTVNYTLGSTVAVFFPMHTHIYGIRAGKIEIYERPTNT